MSSTFFFLIFLEHFIIDTEIGQSLGLFKGTRGRSVKTAHEMIKVLIKMAVLGLHEETKGKQLY